MGAFSIRRIDPLIRNLNADPEIRMKEMKTRVTKIDVKFKACVHLHDLGNRVFTVCTAG